MAPSLTANTGIPDAPLPAPTVRIIARAPNWLGDAIMALPTLAALRAAYPQAQLTVACREAVREVFAANPEIDEVLTVPRGLMMCAQAWSLRRERFDRGLLLTNSFATAAWMRISGVRNRLGYRRDGRWLLLSCGLPATRELLAAHQSTYYLSLLRAWGIDPTPTLPHLPVSPAGLLTASRFLTRIGFTMQPYAVIAPSSAFGAVKDWEISRYGIIARQLVKTYDLTVLLTGTSAQREALAAIADAPRIINAAGEVSLSGLFALIQQAQIFVGGDSGAAHCAAALNTPTVSIFGITEPIRTRPLGDPAKIRVVGKGGIITPDFRSLAVRRAARLALDAITVEEVWRAITEIIRRR